MLTNANEDTGPNFHSQYKRARGTCRPPANSPLPILKDESSDSPGNESEIFKKLEHLAEQIRGVSVLDKDISSDFIRNAARAISLKY